MASGLYTERYLFAFGKNQYQAGIRVHLNTMSQVTVQQIAVHRRPSDLLLCESPNRDSLAKVEGIRTIEL